MMMGLPAISALSILVAVAASAKLTFITSTLLKSFAAALCEAAIPCNIKLIIEEYVYDTIYCIFWL